jgi:N-carbamoylputrescine amidase
MSLGVVAAVRSGAFGMSSNRVDSSGTYGGTGWIISPEGEILARTTREAQFATIEIDLAASAAARDGYPCNVWKGVSA